MPKECPDCRTIMLPANDFDCEKATWICPECAPEFVLANATTFTETKDPMKAGRR